MNKNQFIYDRDLMIVQPTIFLSENIITIDEKRIDLLGKHIQKMKLKNVYYIEIWDTLMKQQIYGNEVEINDLFEKLKKYCIQQNFTNHYKLCNVLGQGGQATVYRVKNIKTQRVYAAKCIIQEKKNSLDDGILKEISIMVKLNHERCVILHEIFQENDQIFLILDYLAGGELFQYLQDQRTLLDENSIKDIIFTLFEGLEYIHSKNIIHRDLKPQNILLRKRQNIFDLVISDFGLADFQNKQCQYLYQTCGTIGYVAPEILRLERYDEKVDVFSIGSILYTLFSGKLLVNDQKQIRKGQYPKPDYSELEERGLSDNALDFLKGCLKVIPGLRLSVKEALTHKWFKIPIKSKFFTDYSINCFSVQKDTQMILSNNSTDDTTVVDDDQPIKVLEMLKTYNIQAKQRSL